MLTTVPALRSRAGKRLGYGDVTEQIHLEQSAPLGNWQRFDRRVDRDPGVVDQRAQRPAQRIAGDPVGDGGHIRVDRDVEDVRLDPLGP